MFRVEASCVIERPISDVWAYISNLDNQPAWDPGLVEVKWKPPLGDGSLVELRDDSLLLRLLGRASDRATVTEYREGRAFALRFSHGPSFLQAKYELDPVESGHTRLTRVAILNGIGAWRLLEVALRRRAVRERAAEITNIKRILESERPATSG
jgi:hypothetical protein